MKKTFLFCMGMGIIDRVMTSVIAQNYIANGKFSQNNCAQDFCIFDKPEDVKGWIPDPQIQIGYGYIYNPSLGNQRVLELAPNKTDVSNKELENYILVYIDGQVKKKITPQNYQIQKDSIDIQIQDKTQIQVKFCSVGGDENSHGAILRTVSMTKKKLNETNHKVDQQSQVQQQKDQQQKAQDLPTLVIDSHIDRCYQKQYQLQKGSLLISFDYSIDSEMSVKDSAVYVLFDGKQIYKILPVQNGLNIKLRGEVSQGSHTIGFCTAGAQNEVPHKIKIGKVQITQPN